MAARRRTGSNTEPLCSIERTLEIIGDRWTLLVLREALISRSSRFADFEQVLGIAPTVLTNRLDVLLDAGLLEKRPYREAGARTRFSYHPTPAGEQLVTVLGALQQWGDEHIPPKTGPSTLRRTVTGNRPVSIAFVDDRGRPLTPSDVAFVAKPVPRTR